MLRLRSVFFLAALLFVGMPTFGQAATFNCSFRCMRVRIFPGSTCNTGSLELENHRFYEAVGQRMVPVTVPDGTAAPACSTSVCQPACRSACGGRLVGERAENTWLNGEMACLNEIPSYITAANTLCRSVDGADIASLALITPDFVSRYREEAVPTCVPPPPPGQVVTTTSPNAGFESARGTCRFSCEHGATRSVYRGERVACNIDADCLGRCSDACRNSVGTGAAGQTPSCVTQNMTPTPRPEELPRCEIEGAGSPTTLENPLYTTDIGEMIARFIRALTGIAGSLALLMFVVGGVIWMTAEGSDRVQLAQTILKNASLGLVLIFFAYSIVSLFLSVLGL